jgi:hypothetical protein
MELVEHAGPCPPIQAASDKDELVNQGRHGQESPIPDPESETTPSFE